MLCGADHQYSIVSAALLLVEYINEVLLSSNMNVQRLTKLVRLV
jgi:hypothetical protein